MKYLIIGKHGQLAQELSRCLENSGVDYTACGKDECDVSRTDVVNTLLNDLKPEVVINTSAYNLVPAAEVDPDSAFKLNCFAVSNLALICKKKNIRFVTYSTDYVFDGQKNAPYFENDSPNPLQMYGLSKYAGEIACINQNSNSIIIRTNGVYGGLYGSPQKNGNFVLSILKEARQKRLISLSSPCVVNPTSAKDLAIATLELLSRDASQGIYHLASEGACSLTEFAKYIVSEAKIDCEVELVPNQTEVLVKRPQFSVLENTRAKEYGIVLPDWKMAVQNYLEEIV